MKKKIAILYIATGKYSVFWEKFYQSSQKYLLDKHSKHYFVFTDDQDIITKGDVTSIYKKSEGFPLDSLFRFEMFWSIREQLLEYDFVFFFNANMIFVGVFGDECLPSARDSGLVALLHPTLYDKAARLYPYERNKRSTAYIPFEKKRYHYYMGSLNGGRSKDYLKLIKKCMENVRADYENGIIAIFHDESHLNCYLNNKKILKLSPSYGYPENFNLPFKKIVTMLEKTNVSASFSKAPNESFLKAAKRRLFKLYNILFW